MTVTGKHGILLLNQYAFVIWLAATNDVNVRSLGFFYKSSTTGTITFGLDNANDTRFKIVRSGDSFTITATSATSMKWIGN